MIKRTLLNKSIDELEKAVQNEYLRLVEKLMSYLMDLYISILDEGVPLHSHLYQFNRYYEMVNKIQTELTTLGIRENMLFDERLTKLYQDNIELLGEQLDLSSYVRTQDLLSLVKRDWVGDGMNYSDRI